MSYLRLAQSKTFLQKPIPIKMNEIKIKCETNDDNRYSLFLNTQIFDPNTESSPPNTFMQNLQERMNNYYSPGNSPVNSLGNSPGNSPVKI